MFRFWSFFLCFSALCILLLGNAAVASAKRYSVDVTCEQLSHLPPAIVEQVPHWLPGWWGAHVNDPYVNAMRTHLLVNAMSTQCQRNLNTRILDTMRSVTSLPAVPDNALTLTCQQFAGSDDAWQTIVFHWLQGYTAYTNGSALIDDKYMPTLDRLYDHCTANPRMTVKDALRRVGGAQK